MEKRMRNLMMVSVAAVSLLCTSSVMANDKTKAPTRYNPGSGDPVSTISRTSDRMAEIIQRELKQVLRSAKVDFTELKRITRGNYQAEGVVYRLGESMGTVESLCQKLEQRLLPQLMEAARQISSQNGGHNGGYDNGYGNNNHHGGNNNGGHSGYDNNGYSGYDNNISAIELSRMMDKELAGSNKLRVLENSVTYVHMFDGVAIVKIVSQFLSGSNQSRACEIIASRGRFTMSSQDLCKVLDEMLADGDKLKAAKALVRGVADINPITVERISQCFISPSGQREFRRFALANNNHY
jgi:hypothetical protein